MDVLRGLSIVAVVLLHLRLRLSSAHISIAPSLPHWLTYLVFNNGNNGVTVFFAVSGFLITRTSIHRFGSLATWRSAVRRPAPGLHRHGPVCALDLDQQPIWQEKSHLGGIDGIALGRFTALLVERAASGASRSKARLLQVLRGTGVALILFVACWPPGNG